MAAPRLYSGPGLFAESLGNALGSIPAGLLTAEQQIPDVIAKTQGVEQSAQLHPFRMQQAELQPQLTREQILGAQQAREQSGIRFPLDLDALRANLAQVQAQTQSTLGSEARATRAEPGNLAHTAATTEHVGALTGATKQQTAQGAEQFGWERSKQVQLERERAQMNKYQDTFLNRINSLQQDPDPAIRSKAGMLLQALNVAPPDPQSRWHVITAWMNHVFQNPHSSDFQWMMGLPQSERQAAMDAYGKMYGLRHPGNPGMDEHRKFASARDALKVKLQAYRQLVMLGANALMQLPPNPETGKPWTPGEVQMKLKHTQDEYDRLVATYRNSGGNPDAPVGLDQPQMGIVPPPGFFNIPGPQ